MTDRYLRGWEKIEALFPMYAPWNVRKKYGREMIKNGWVMKSTESYAHKKDLSGARLCGRSNPSSRPSFKKNSAN